MQQSPGPGASRPRRNTVFFAVAGLAMLMIAAMFLQPAQPAPSELALSDLATAVRAGEVSSIVVRGDTLDVTMQDGKTAIARPEPNASLTESLRNYGVTDQQLSAVTLRVTRPSDVGAIFGSLIWLLPIVLIFAFWIFALRRGSGAGGAGQMMDFTRSHARRASIDHPQGSFGDVAGADEAKQDLTEVVDFLKHPENYAALGAHVPKGVLLVGPPGTGKTLLARAVAGEAGGPFFSISGSEFVELFVGVGAARVRDLFAQAKQNAPAIMFIDEIDAVGRQRGTGLGQTHEEREQTLNQILAEMDGFDKTANAIVIAATNRPDVLDPALLRPGRFDRRIVVDLPDLQGRLAILQVHSRGIPLGTDVDLERIARLTPGFSGADLANLINEGALLAARRKLTRVTMDELEEAVDRVVVGPERRSRRMSDRERLITAYHEAGHALAAHLLPGTDPVHKVSIVARGMSGGHTHIVPEEDRHLWTEPQLRDALAYALGGLVAEELIFGERSTGASNDLERATIEARQMVTRYGMSNKVGPVAFGHAGHEVFLGRDLGLPREYSEVTASLIDSEVRGILEEARERARNTLGNHRSRLDAIATKLLEVETLQGDELRAVLGPRPSSAAAAEDAVPAIPLHDSIREKLQERTVEEAT